MLFIVAKTDFRDKQCRENGGKNLLKSFPILGVCV